MKYLILSTVFLAGCVGGPGQWLADQGFNVHVPIANSQVEYLCSDGAHDFTYKGETKTFLVHTTDDPEQLFDWCGNAPNGKAAPACISANLKDIYTGLPCKHLGHEVSHGFGIIPDRDRPEIGFAQ